MFTDRFEAVVPSAGAVSAVAQGAEWEVEIVANYQDILRGDFVEMHEGLDSYAGIIVVILGFDEDTVAVLEPEGTHFGLLPVDFLDFGVKIQRQKAEIVAGEVVFAFGIAEADDELH